MNDQPASSRFHPGRIFSFCPRCGREFEFKEPNFFRCESCGFQYYHGVNAAVAGIITNVQGQILMIRRASDPAKGKLDLPGGFLAYNEKAEDGLLREIKEELNLSIKTLTYFGTFPNIYLWRGLDYYTLDVVFICTPDSFNSLKTTDEEGEAVFVTPEPALLEHVGFSSTKQVIEHYLKIHHSSTT